MNASQIWSQYVGDWADPRDFVSNGEIDELKIDAQVQHARAEKWLDGTISADELRAAISEMAQATIKYDADGYPI